MDDEIEILRTPDIARAMKMTDAAVRQAINRGMDGITIPPSIKLGDRRVWRKIDVIAWLDALGGKTSQKRGRGRPKKSAGEGQGQ